jgi:diguanylate cyclase (GGDEF)-like protein
MPEAPRAASEIKRLAAVQRTRLLGTPAEERFDRITRLAKRLFDVPLAALDIVGESLAWLKSVQGFDAVEGLRKDSYCHYTVLDNEICLVHDARCDPRVSDSAFADTWVFYAGVALHFEGQRIGVLCIGDTTPRHFDDEHLDALRDLAALAEHEIQVAVLSEAQMTLAATNEELEMKTRVDELTRLWNRQAIMEVAAMEQLQDGENVALGILMIDLDQFKLINDTHGHLAGDQVLRVVSERLRAGVRPMDAVGRFGGEEFLAVLTGLTHEDVVVSAERIRGVIAKSPIAYEERAIPVTCSIGCTLSTPGDDVDTMVKRADVALYRAKALGRNRVEMER